MTDPLELAEDAGAARLRRRIYAALADRCNIDSTVIRPNEPWLHFMVQPTRRGSVHVLYNTKRSSGTENISFDSAAGPAELSLRNGWPGLLVTTKAGRAVMACAHGMVGVQGQLIFRSQGQMAALSLDGLDLRKSRAILMAPFDVGSFEMADRDVNVEPMFGDYQNGVWKTHESISPARKSVRFELDQDRATTLVLVCPPEERQRWESYLTRVLWHPDSCAGY